MPSARLRAGGRVLRRRRCPAAGCPSVPDLARARGLVLSLAHRWSPPAGDNPTLARRRGRASCSSRCPRRRGPELRSCSRPSQRQREYERASLARLAVDPDTPVVQLNESLRKREPETCALALTGTHPRLLELLKDPLLILGRDARAGIRNRHKNLTVDLGGLQIDVPSRRRELHRVREKVEDHLPNSPLVALDEHRARIELEPESNAVIRRTLPHHDDAALDRLPQGA